MSHSSLRTRGPTTPPISDMEAAETQDARFIHTDRIHETHQAQSQAAILQRQWQTQQARLRELYDTGAGQGFSAHTQAPAPRQAPAPSWQYSTQPTPQQRAATGFYTPARFPGAHQFRPQAPGAIGQVPTLPELRNIQQLNQQADAIIYGNRTTANMFGAQPRMTGPYTHEQDLAAFATPTAINQGNSPHMYRDYTYQSSPVKERQSDLSPEMFCHRPGCTELKFEQLTMSEYVEGFLNIVLYCQQLSPADRWARLERLSEIMSLTNTYQWSKVRAMCGILQKEVTQGRRTWHDSVTTLRERMLRPIDAIQTNVERPKSEKRQVDTSHICKSYNYNNCDEINCVSSHICQPCFRIRGIEASHTASNCPHKPPRRA